MTTALVTGASSGIGAVYARRFAARGHDLVLVARTTDRLNALAAELRYAHGIGVEIITADLTDGAQIDKVCQRLRSNPPIDILVNNAGAALNGGFVTAEAAEMYKLLRLNVLAPTMLASAAIGGMVERGGRRHHQYRIRPGTPSRVRSGHIRGNKILHPDPFAESCRRSVIQGCLCTGRTSCRHPDRNFRARGHRHQPVVGDHGRRRSRRCRADRV